jgi:hypothetical protein
MITIHHGPAPVQQLQPLCCTVQHASCCYGWQSQLGIAVAQTTSLQLICPCVMQCCIMKPAYHHAVPVQMHQDCQTVCIQARVGSWSQ